MTITIAEPFWKPFRLIDIPGFVPDPDWVLNNDVDGFKSMGNFRLHVRAEVQGVLDLAAIYSNDPDLPATLIFSKDVIPPAVNSTVEFRTTELVRTPVFERRGGGVVGAKEFLLYSGDGASLRGESRATAIDSRYDVIEAGVRVTAILNPPPSATKLLLMVRYS